MTQKFEDLIIQHVKTEILAEFQKMLETFEIAISEMIDRKIAEAEDKHLDNYEHVEKAVSAEELEKENPT